MSSLASYVAGGLALMLAVDFALPLPRAGSAMDLLAGSGFSGPDARANNAVDRTLKGDRLTAVAPAKRAQTKIASVEIVGLTNTAVVYRDGEGRELFRTDPLSNATVVAKGVSLPEVTIRYSGATPATPTPVIAPIGRGTPDGKPPVGCEPPISPLAGSVPSGAFGRCIAKGPGPGDRAVSVASLEQSIR